MASSSRSIERRINLGVRPVEDKGFVGMESDRYELHKDETEHDHLGEADGDTGDGVELENNLDAVGGMYDDLYIVDFGELLGSIDFVNLSREKVCRFNFADVDIAFDFYQELVCHREGFRSLKFYSIPNQQKRPRAETRCGCPARMQVCMDDESEYWYVTYFSDEHNHPVLDLLFSSMFPSHRRMSEADIE
ncbi:hypothetical protein Ahy_B02g060015 [Arachis hypogaea]|uniref:WRKY domain-containing protein n=1 Tax=Arachis hypogaea TaxID=3818 RepID=A0A445AHN0_ARAHY|nr:hypothetical protein Ahy_B02g060015 [Arachis hypogaea]